MRLLVIDDDPLVIRLVRFALERAGGIDVVAATTPVEGLRLALDEQPDAVLLDVVMPELSGLAVLAALRARDATRNLPVIFLSAKSRPDEIAALFAAGALGVIHKPFDPAGLADEVRSKLGLTVPAEGTSEIPDEMRRSFLLSAVERINTIERSLDLLHRDPGDRGHVEAIGGEMHHLAGVAGMYGLTPVSDGASRAEEECDQLVSAAAAPKPETLHRWQDLVKEMREHIAAASTSLGGPKPYGARRAFRLLCVDADAATEAALRVLDCDSTFAVELARSATDAATALESGVPDVLLVTTTLPDSSAFDMIDQMRASPHGNRAGVLVITSRRLTAAEVSGAVRRGVDGFLEYPVNLEDLLTGVRSVVDRKFGPSPRVLCIGGEQYAASFARVIESAGYKLRTSDHNRYVLADVEGFEPDLILATVDDEPAALDLIRSVRLHAGPAVPVVLIASAELPDLPVHAALAGAADVLRLPLSRALLLSTVENCIHFARTNKNAAQRDPLTGCLRETPFRQRLQRRLNDRPSRTVTLALLEPEAAVLHGDGRSLRAEAAILSLADLLRRRLRDTDDIGRCARHRFAVTMERIREGDAVALFRRLLDEFEAPNRNLDQSERRSFRVAIAAEAGDPSADALIRRAEEALRLAGKDDRIVTAVAMNERRAAGSATDTPRRAEPSVSS